MVKPTPSPLPFVEQWRRAILASDLPLTAKVTAFGLAIHMNGDGTSTRPGLVRIGDETNLGRASIVRARSHLVARGWLEMVAVGGSARGGNRSANEYRGVIPQHRYQDDTGAVVTPVSTEHRYQDEHGTGAVVSMEPVSQRAPRNDISNDIRGGLQVLRESGLFLTDPRPPLIKELDDKITELEQIHGVDTVTRAINTATDWDRTYTWPSGVIAALTGIIRANAPTTGAAPPPTTPNPVGCAQCDRGWIHQTDGSELRCQCVGGPIPQPRDILAEIDDLAPPLPTKPPPGLTRVSRPASELPPF